MRAVRDVVAAGAGAACKFVDAGRQEAEEAGAGAGACALPVTLEKLVLVVGGGGAFLLLTGLGWYDDPERTGLSKLARDSFKGSK